MPVLISMEFSFYGIKQRGISIAIPVHGLRRGCFQLRVSQTFPSRLPSSLGGNRQTTLHRLWNQIHHTFGGFTADEEGLAMGPTPSSSGRILVVDDDPDIADALVQMLTECGNQVTVSRTGPAARGDCRKIAGPGRFWIWTCRAFMGSMFAGESRPMRPRLIPVLILTGSERSRRPRRRRAGGADEYLTKPARSSEVLARCRSLLRLKAAMDELDSEPALGVCSSCGAKCPSTLGHTERTHRIRCPIGQSSGDGGSQERSCARPRPPAPHWKDQHARCGAQ